MSIFDQIAVTDLLLRLSGGVSFTANHTYSWFGSLLRLIGIIAPVVAASNPLTAALFLVASIYINRAIEESDWTEAEKGAAKLAFNLLSIYTMSGFNLDSLLNAGTLLQVAGAGIDIAYNAAMAELESELTSWQDEIESLESDKEALRDELAEYNDTIELEYTNIRREYSYDIESSYDMDAEFNYL